MDFRMDDEQKALADSVRSLAGRHPGRAEGAPATGPVPHDAQRWSQLAELGAFGLPFAEEVGGYGASLVEAGVVATELGRAQWVTPYPEVITAGAMLAVAGDQHAETIGAIAEGEQLVLPALYEPRRAWDPFGPTVTATQDGDSWRLSGTKEPVRFAGDADAFVVSAKTDDGPAVFLVRDAQVTGGSRVVLDGTSAQLVGTSETATQVLAAGLTSGIAVLAAEALGCMEGALATTVEYLKTRKQFGVPLAAFQALTFRAADMYAAVELARSATLFAGLAISADPQDVDTACRTKVVLGQSARLVGQEAIQLHGGIGVTAEHQVGHWTARLNDIEHTLGDTRHHLAYLAASIGEHRTVEVLA